MQPETPVGEANPEANPVEANPDPSVATESNPEDANSGETPQPAAPKPAVVIVPPEIAKTPEKKPEPKPATSNPAGASSEDKKPADKKAEAKPTTPSAKPFEGFASRITLPPLKADKRNKLGPVKIPDDYLCVVSLHGGETASSERAAISLEATPMSERDWDIVAKSYSKGQPQKIAHLQVKDQGLWLTWTEEGVQNEAAPALANCLLKLSAGQGAHSVFLRPAITGESVPVKYEKETYDWDIPNLPQTSKVQVEFDVKSGSKDLPRPRFLGSAAVPLANGQTQLEFGLKAGERFLKLQLQTRGTTRGLSLTVSPWVQVTGQPNAVALTNANVEKLEQTLAASAVNLDAQIKGADKATQTKLKKERSAVSTAQTELGKLKSLKKELESKVRINVKVNYVAEDMIAELMRTK